MKSNRIFLIEYIKSEERQEKIKFIVTIFTSIDMTFKAYVSDDSFRFHRGALTSIICVIRDDSPSGGTQVSKLGEEQEESKQHFLLLLFLIDDNAKGETKIK
jgi:hypothetical protein